MRSPKWHECEIMLALHLYLNRGLDWCTKITDSTAEIAGLSKVLNGLDFYMDKPDNFRSPGSIRMRMANFMSLDPDYKGKALDNSGPQVKKLWTEYSESKQELHTKCVEILSSHLVLDTKEVLEYIRLMKLDETEKEIRDTNFTKFASELERMLSYYEKLATDMPKIDQASKVAEWCNKTRQSMSWIGQLPKEIDFIIDTSYKEHGGINLAPIKKGKKVEHTQSYEEGEKIGKLVQRTFRLLVEQGKLTKDIIEKLQETKYSHDNFGLKLPFLKRIDEEKTIKEQLLDENGYVRYWTNPVEIDGFKYCINKEWFENQRSKYLKWHASVDIKKFYMVNKSNLKKVLVLIKKLDERKVSISKKEIYEKFEQQMEIETVVNILIDDGILSGFQGSTKELVIDDYDAFFRMLNNPEDYALE